MWTLTENAKGDFTAIQYTMVISNNQSIRKTISQKNGNLKEVVNFLLSFENIGMSDIEQALSMMDETGDDTCEFGVLGSPIFTTNTQLSAVA